MNKLFLINDMYYVIAFDYYDAITIFKKYENNYSEDIVEKIELVNSNVIQKANIVNEEEEDDND